MSEFVEGGVLKRLLHDPHRRKHLTQRCVGAERGARMSDAGIHHRTIECRSYLSAKECKRLRYARNQNYPMLHWVLFRMAFIHLLLFSGPSSVLVSSNSQNTPGNRPGPSFGNEEPIFPWHTTPPSHIKLHSVDQ